MKGGVLEKLLSFIVSLLLDKTLEGADLCNPPVWRDFDRSPPKRSCSTSPGCPSNVFRIFQYFPNMSPISRDAGVRNTFLVQVGRNSVGALSP